MNEFSAGECISFGWETFKKRSGFFVGLSILYVVASFAVGQLSGVLARALGAASGPIMTNLSSIVLSTLFGAVLSMGMVSFVLRAHDDVEHASIDDAWRSTPYWYFLAASILKNLAIIIGLVLLVVPGIIIGLALAFVGYLVVDQGMKPAQALKESDRITKGHKGTLFMLALFSIGVGILGFVCLLVGIFVAFPVIILAWTHAYRVLRDRALAATAPEPAL